MRKQLIAPFKNGIKPEIRPKSPFDNPKFANVTMIRILSISEVMPVGY
jgi:hypothetical protein